MRKTKIICTLGPATDDENVMRELILNGMAVARMNMSHGTHEDHKKRADVVKRIRAELDIPVALLLDTKGPEIRTKNFKNGSEILEAGQTFTFTTDDIEGDSSHCSITFADLPKDVRRGDRILVDDGLIEMLVTSTSKKDIVCEVLNGGKIASHKGINVPGTRLSLPFISEQDKKDIAFAVEQDLDFIAASFTRSSDDILKLRAELDKNNCNNIRIIAKIENAEGVDNIDDIIRVSDGIMVARGDLGVEIPMEDIPILQKKLITKAYKAGKQVITATQMLDSMMKNPRPTRAEAADVANAIYDGTTATMLSGETAAGKYPIEAVKAMSRIAEYTENQINYQDRYLKNNLKLREDVVNTIVSASVEASFFLKAKAIVVATVTGFTALTASYYRPSGPIIASCTNEKASRQLKLDYGVYPYHAHLTNDLDEMRSQALQIARSSGVVKAGDLVVLICGSITSGQSSSDTMIITKA